MRHLVPTVIAFLLLAGAAHGLTARGRVVGEDGEPVAEARAELARNAINRGDSGPYRTTADSDGRFEVTGVPEGWFDLTVVADGYLRAVQRGFELKDTGDATDLGTVVLHTGHIREGRVTGPEGKPLAGVQVQVTEMRVTLPQPLTAAPRSVTDADELISEEDEDLPEGCRIVEPVQIPDEEKVTLSGRVIGVPPGDLAETRIYAWSPGRGYVNGVVRWDGTYQIPSLTPGEWEVRAQVRTSRPVVVRTVIAAGQEPKLDVARPGPEAKR